MAFTTEKDASTRTTSVSTHIPMEEDGAGNRTDDDNTMENSALDTRETIEGLPSTSTSVIEVQMDEQTKKAFYIKTLMGIVFVLIVVFIIVDSIMSMHALDAIHEFLDWVEENPFTGVFAVVLGASLLLFTGCLVRALVS